MNGEFLQLLNLVESGRMCNGQDCSHIPEGDVLAAEEIDRAASSHLEECEAEAVDISGCAKCADLTSQRIALREKLHSEGHSFPTEVFDST